MSKILKELYILTGRAVFTILYPLFALYLGKDARTRVVLWHEGKVLLVRAWLGNGEWDLPGGGMHKNESPAQGAVREVVEELGIKIMPKELLPLGSTQSRSGLINLKLHFFQTKLNKPPTIKLQKIEITDAQWFSLRELDNLKTNTHAIQIIRDSKTEQ